MRIAIGGFLHESHSFAPVPTRWEDFQRPAGNPPFSRGPAMLDALRGSAASAGAAIVTAEKAGATVVPLLWCTASPAGPVQDTAFERVAALLCAAALEAQEAGPLDGIMLDLHGAGVAVSAPDMEGELLRRLRHVVGPVPISITLDPHANMTALMLENCDVIVPYRTYPHVDMRPTGARAMELLLQRIARGKPFAHAFRQLDYWMSITAQCTLMDPMASVMTRRAALEAQPGMVELAWCFGFPYADFADCGPALAAYADTQAQADAIADAFLAGLTARETDFRLDVLPAADAVAAALKEPAGPVVLADIQDNPGGGGHGDTTGLLAALIQQGATGAVVCSINDAESAAACTAAGEGATVSLSLGGKSDGVPLLVTAKVLALRDERFPLTGPMSAGNMADLGPCALIEIDPGVRVIVASRKIQAYDRAIVRHMGLAPEEQRILALKSSVHFRADFGPIASRIFCAVAPGPVTADSSTLPFQHVRPNVRKRPGG